MRMAARAVNPARAIVGRFAPGYKLEKRP